jgi:hypothetical protein
MKEKKYMDDLSYLDLYKIYRKEKKNSKYVLKIRNLRSHLVDIENHFPSDIFSVIFSYMYSKKINLFVNGKGYNKIIPLVNISGSLANKIDEHYFVEKGYHTLYHIIRIDCLMNSNKITLLLAEHEEPYKIKMRKIKKMRQVSLDFHIFPELKKSKKNEEIFFDLLINL